MCLVVDFLVICIVDATSPPTKLAGVFNFDISLENLFLNMFRKRHNIQAAIATRAEHFLVYKGLTLENSIDHFSAINFPAALELKLPHRIADRNLLLCQNFDKRLATRRHRGCLQQLLQCFRLLKYGLKLSHQRIQLIVCGRLKAVRHLEGALS